MSPTRRPCALLRASLRANAAFSAVSGVVLTLAGGPVAAFLGVAPAALVTAVGANLLGFAAALVWIAARPLVPFGWVRVIIALDVGWVAGTAGLVGADALSAAGATAAIAVADGVALFAVLQAVGLRRATRPQPAG